MVALIIPALNPDRRVLALVKAVKELEPEIRIVVVDDGSGKQSQTLFDRLKQHCGCTVCRHPENCGKGAALKTGIAYLMVHGPDCTGYLTADADGQHKPGDIVAVAKAMERNPHSVILGVRDFSQTQVPGKNRWGNRITAEVFRRVTGMSCSDTQTGLRGIPAAYGDLALEIPGTRFEYEMNFLLYAAGQRIPMEEIPIRTVYAAEGRTSHFRSVRDSARIYRAILGYSLGRRMPPRHGGHPSPEREKTV